MNLISHSSVLFRKDLGFYNDQLSSQIDYEFWLRCLSGGKLFAILNNTPLTFHRIHDGQSFENRGLSYKVNSIKLVNKYALKYLKIDILILNNLKILYYLFSRVFRGYLIR